MKKILFSIAMCLWCALCVVPHANAEDIASMQSQISELKMLVQDLKGVMERQGQEIVLLKERLEERGARSDGAAATPAVAAGSRSLQGRWNPDIGVVADTVLTLDSPKEDAEGADRVSVREIELVFGSAVDPYSRFDATLSVSDFENLGIEEAYLTRFDLPLDMTARIGRFKPRVGKAILAHRDSLDTVDEPLVIQRYFGAEGFSKTGADLTRPIDLPWAMTHQMSVGVLEGGNGEAGTLFGDTLRRPTLYANLKNYLDLNDSTGIELGLSGLSGSRDDDETFETNVIGFDGTLTHRLGDQRHIKLQGESFLVNRTESFYPLTDDATGEVTEQDLDDTRHLWGGYALVDWRFHPQWATGFRLDKVQLIETAADFANPLQSERGYTTYLTFYQSEFARWRVQYSHVDLTTDNDDDRVFVQGTFAIGEHKHKIQ